MLLVGILFKFEDIQGGNGLVFLLVGIPFKFEDIQGGLMDLLQLECLSGLEEAEKLAGNPTVQVIFLPEVE